MKSEIFIEGIIGVDVTVDTIRAQYESLGKPKEVTLKINSGGGDVDTGFAIYDYLKSLDIKVNTEVLGMCGSIATIVQQANFNGGERGIHPNSNDFIHNPYYPNESPIPMEARDAKALHEALAKEEERILKFYVEHTGKDEAVIKAKMDAQTKLTAEEAKELGFVDTILNKEVFSLKSYKVVAFYNVNKNSNMDILKKLGEIENKINSFLKPQIKNEMKKLSEGVEAFYEGALGVNTPLFKDEAMTAPAPDGVHTVDGKKYTVSEGKVTAVEDAPVAAEDALKAEIEALRVQLAEKESAIVNKDTELTKVVAEKAEAVAAIETVNTEFKNFKALFVTGSGELKPEFQAYKGEGNETKKSIAEKVIELRNAQKK